MEGSTVNFVSGGGVAGVKVDLYSSEDLNRVAYSTSTDAEGHFRIDGIPAGSYQARYEPPGEWGTVDAGIPKPFQVTAAGIPVKLEQRLMPRVRLSGRVIDGRGNAVPKAVLQLGRRRSMFPDTDAQGKFDLHLALLPGDLTLAVTPPPASNHQIPEPRAPPESPRVLAWVRTWYPGVAAPEAAWKIVLPAGGELAGIELKLLAVPAYPVRGVLLDPENKPVPHAEINLAGVPQSLAVESKSDGSFEFPAVVDGEFYLESEVERGEKLRAKQLLEVAGHKQEGVKLQLHAPFTVRGKAVMVTPDGLPAPKAPSSVLLSPSERTLTFGENPLAHRVNAYPTEDGNFSLEYVYPGSYEILSAPPPAYYLDEVRVGEVQPSRPEVELSSGAVSITLVYKTNGGTVRGIVEKCAAGGVVIVPQDPAMRWPDLIRDARCDSDGHYEITAVRPAEYYALALPGNGSSQLRPPNWPLGAPDDGLLNQGAAVTVRAGEAASADLRAIAPAN